MAKKPKLAPPNPSRIADAADAALGAGTPRAVLDAALPDAAAGALTFQPFVLTAYRVLEKLEHPLIKPPAGGKPPEMSTLDLMRALYVFSTPIHTVRNTLASGLPDFDAAVEAFCDGIALTDLGGVAAALARHLGQAFATAIPPAENDKKKAEAPASAGP
jgi:hypothetical protein